MDMQITPIIPTTDSLVTGALAVLKVVGKWLIQRLVAAFCVKIYCHTVNIPYTVLGAAAYFHNTKILESGFVWFSEGVGLGFVAHREKFSALLVPQVVAEKEKFVSMAGSSYTSPFSVNEITLPRWKHGAFKKASARIAQMCAAPPSISPNKMEYNEPVRRIAAAVARWQDQRNWFDQRNISHTLGLMLYGPPGSGKSTLANDLARLLNRRIRKLDLSSVEKLHKSADFDEKASYHGDYSHIWLIEDIDSVFHKRTNISRDGSLTFDDLLNLLSGTTITPGRVVVITTNHPEVLDPALAHVPGDGSPPIPRPGRIDYVVYVGPLDKEVRERVVARVFPDRPDLWHDLVVAGEGETIALFQARCVTLALELKAKENT